MWEHDDVTPNWYKLDLIKNQKELGLDHLTLSVDSYLSDPVAEEDLQCIRLFCSAVRGSVVMLMPGPDFLSVAVGVLGRYLAMVTVPANTRLFPNSGEMAWGHIIVLSDKKLHRSSVVDGISQFVGDDGRSELTLPLIPLRQLSPEVANRLCKF